MSKDSLPPTGSTDLSDAISLMFDDGSKVKMSESFATTLDKKMDYLSANGGEGSERYSMTDEFYDQVGHAASLMNRSAVDANRDNVDLLDAAGIDYMQDLASLFMTQQGRAVESGAEKRGDAGRIKYFADGFRGAYDKAMDARKPDEPAEEASATPATAARTQGAAPEAGGSDGDMDMSGVKEMLADVAETDNSSAKSSKLSDAIAALIAQIRGTAEPEPSGEAGGLKGKIDDLVETIGGKSGGGATPASAAEEDEAEEADAAPAPEPKTTKLEGDALMGRLDAGGRGLTFDSSDGGIGIRGREKDEIDRGEKMTFRPEEPASGGSVDLVDLFGTGKKGQETATISVMKDGKEVDQITVRGDMDGDQTVKIDEAFDELVFESGGGKSNFAVKSITTETGGEAPEAPDAPDAPEPAPGADDGEEAARADFDITQLLDLLQALSDTIALIDGAEALSDQERGALLDKVAEVIEPIADALDADGEGGEAVTAEEVATIMEGVSGLNEGIEAEIDDSGTKNDALDALAMGVGKVADELA